MHSFILKSAFFHTTMDIIEFIYQWQHAYHFNKAYNALQLENRWSWMIYWWVLGEIIHTVCILFLFFSWVESYPTFFNGENDEIFVRLERCWWLWSFSIHTVNERNIYTIHNHSYFFAPFVLCTFAFHKPLRFFTALIVRARVRRFIFVGFVVHQTVI